MARGVGLGQWVGGGERPRIKDDGPQGLLSVLTRHIEGLKVHISVTKYKITVIILFLFFTCYVIVYKSLNT